MAFDLGGFGSLLGGISALFGGGNTTKQSWKGAYGSLVGHAEGAIEGYKRTGINPLTLLGVTPSSGLPGQNYFGQAVADAGMLLADAFASREDVGRLERAERLNEKLRKQVTDLVLRPAVPGVYGAGNGGSGNAAPDRQRAVVSGGDEAVGPSRGDFGLVDPQSRNVSERVHSHDQFTDIPVGPDLDEVITGVFIDANNRHKAREAFRARTDMTFGDPLAVPRKTTWVGLVPTPFSSAAPWELLPPEAPEKPRYKTVMRNGKRVRVRKSAWDK